MRIDRFSFIISCVGLCGQKNLIGNLSLSLSLSFWRHLCHCQKLDYVSHHISIVGHKPYTMFWPCMAHMYFFRAITPGDRVIQGWRITRKRPRRPQIWSRARARSSWRRPNLSDLTLDGSYMGNHLKDNWGWIMIIWIICDLCVYCDSSHIHIISHPSTLSGSTVPVAS